MWIKKLFIKEYRKNKKLKEECVAEKISLPPTEIQREGGVQKMAISEGRWVWPLESFFRGLQVRLMSKLSVILLLIGVSIQSKNFCFHGWSFICGRLSDFFTVCTVVYVTWLSSVNEITSSFLSVALLHNILWYSV